MTVGSADRQKPTQKLYELLAQKNHKVNTLVCDAMRKFERSNKVYSVTYHQPFVTIMTLPRHAPLT